MNLLKHVDFHLVQFLSLTTLWSFQGDYVIIDLKYKTKAYIRSCYHKNALVSYHTIVTVTITISKNKNVLEWKYLRNTIMICIFPKTYTTPQSRLWRYQYASLMIKFHCHDRKTMLFNSQNVTFCVIFDFCALMSFSKSTLMIYKHSHSSKT